MQGVLNRPFLRQLVGVVVFSFLLYAQPQAQGIAFVEEGFYIENLNESQKKEMKQAGVWAPPAPLPMERLRAVHFRYFDFDGHERKEGVLVTLDIAAQSLLTVLKSLHTRKFPIAAAIPIEAYGGDDHRSMSANNTSCFNFRTVKDKDFLSLHAYGLAVDINPVQNPFLEYIPSTSEDDGVIKVYPDDGKEYLNRTNIRPGMVTPEVVAIFYENGFDEWGGNWNSPIDWQHFQVARAVCELLSVMPRAHGDIFFKVYNASSSKILSVRKIRESSRCSTIFLRENPFVSLYKKKPNQFMAWIPEALQFSSSDEALSFLEKELGTRVL